MSSHCNTLWTAMNRLKELESQVSAALRKCETQSFKLGSLRGAMNELSEERNRYQGRLEELVDLGDGRMIQRQDYLAVRRLVAGCHSSQHSTQALWARLLGKTGNEPRLALNDDGSLGRLNLAELDLSEIKFPAFSSLTSLDASINNLTQLVIPGALKDLETLSASENQLTRLVIPDTLRSLSLLQVRQNHLTQLVIPDTLASLTRIYVNDNRLSQFEIPSTLKRLERLNASNNQLVQLEIPVTLKGLNFLDVHYNSGLVAFAVPTTLSIPEVNLGGCPLLSAATRQEARHRGWRLI